MANRELLDAFKYEPEDSETKAKVWELWRARSTDTLDYAKPSIRGAVLNLRHKKTLCEEALARQLEDLLAEGSEDERVSLLQVCKPVITKRRPDPEANIHMDPWIEPGIEVETCLIPKAIVAREPMLAFRNPPSSNEPSFFLYAVDNGDQTMAMCLLDRIVASQHGGNLAEILHQCLQTSSGIDALNKAVSRGDLQMTKALLEFHNTYMSTILVGNTFDLRRLPNSLTTPKDDDSAHEILRELLQYNLAVNKSSIFGLILLDPTHPKQSLVEVLLEGAGMDEECALFTAENITTIVTEGPPQWWNSALEFWRSKERPFCNGDLKSRGVHPLHLAVDWQREDVVEGLLEQCPALASERDADNRFPLWYIHARASDERARQRCSRIRNHIVASLISHEKPNKVREVMRESRSERREHLKTNHILSVHDFNLDLSRIKLLPHDFPQFVTDLTSKSRQALRLETVLTAVIFPELQSSYPVKEIEPRIPTASRPDLAHHSEVEDILQWLWHRMKVTKIIRLVVPDRVEQPIDWDIIHSCVKTFSIKRLSWRTLDLCLTNFGGNSLKEPCQPAPVLYDERPLDEDHKVLDEDHKVSLPQYAVRTVSEPNVAPAAHSLSTLTHLHLYTKGSRAAIEHWLGPWGLVQLKQLKRLKVHIIEDFVTERQSADIEKRLNEALDRLKSSQGLSWTFVVGSRPWSAPQDVLSRRKPENAAILPIPDLINFINAYKTMVESFDIKEKEGKILPARKPTPSKIAIIDDGVMLVTNSKKYTLHDQASRQIVEGKSFVSQEREEYQWFLPDGGGHGTQMASLISSLDPKCQMYVAQVRSSRVGLSMHAVIEAILWAVSLEVDVISLSLALRPPVDDAMETALREAVSGAEAAGIVILCSTMDEGQNTPVAATFPAGLRPKVIAIVACNQYGGLLTYSQRENYDYRLIGSDIRLGPSDYIDTGSIIQGSSVATAIAAGLASLIISCNWLARLLKPRPSARETATSWKIDLVKKKFDGMRPSESKAVGYVLPKLLYGKENPDKAMSPGTFTTLIDESFRL